MMLLVMLNQWTLSFGALASRYASQRDVHSVSDFSQNTSYVKTIVSPTLSSTAMTEDIR